MGKKWHTNKTKPRKFEDVLAIYNNGDVGIDYVSFDDFGERIEINSWEEVAFWQYTDKLFKKELKQLEEE